MCCTKHQCNTSLLFHYIHFRHCFWSLMGYLSTTRKICIKQPILVAIDTGIFLWRITLIWGSPSCCSPYTRECMWFFSPFPNLSIFRDFLTMEWSLMARESIVFYPMQYILTVDIIFDNLFFTEKEKLIWSGSEHTLACASNSNNPVILPVNELETHVLISPEYCGDRKLFPGFY